MRSYRELLESHPTETEIRSYLVEGEQVPVTMRIPGTLRDAAKEEAALRGMSFSALRLRRFAMPDGRSPKCHAALRCLAGILPISRPAGLSTMLNWRVFCFEGL